MEERFLQDLEEQQTTCKYMIKKTVQTKNSPANRPRQPPAAIQHQGQGLGNILICKKSNQKSTSEKTWQGGAKHTSCIERPQAELRTKN